MPGHHLCMARHTLSGATALLLGLAVGVLGSFTDDLFGGGTAIAVVQVVLWIAAALLLARALQALMAAERRTPGARPGRPAGVR